MAPQDPFLLPRYHSGFDNTPKFGSPVLDFLPQQFPHTESTSHRPDFGCNQTAVMSEEANQLPPPSLAANGQLPLDTLPRVTQDIEFDIAAFLALASVQFRLLHQSYTGIYHAWGVTVVFPGVGAGRNAVGAPG